MSNPSELWASPELKTAAAASLDAVYAANRLLHVAQTAPNAEDLVNNFRNLLAHAQSARRSCMPVISEFISARQSLGGTLPAMDGVTDACCVGLGVACAFDILDAYGLGHDDGRQWGTRLFVSAESVNEEILHNITQRLGKKAQFDTNFFRRCIDDELREAAKVRFRSGAETEQDCDEPMASDEGSDEGASRDASRDYLVKVGDLKGILNERARNGSPSEKEYAKLRNELIAIPAIRDALPKLVLKHRTIEEFWQFIKAKYKTWRERTKFLQQEFEPILSWFEDGTTPAKGSPTGRASEMMKVLLLSANPIDSRLNIDEEFRAIDQKIRGSEHRDHVDLIKHGAVRLEDVTSLLMRHKPHVIHFSGHGAVSGIALTGTDGKGRLVPPDAMANIFRTLKDNVRVVLLNACDSAPQARAIVNEIDCAVGMSNEIDDDAAIAFAAAFYEALGYGRSVQAAFDLALIQLEGAGGDRSLAKLYKRRGVKAADIILVNPPRPQ